jgi:hypothetical protein
MGAHALGAAAYAARAAELGSSQQGGDAEIRWQVEHMSQPVRAALRTLPLLGEDPPSPLGAGLLVSGSLGSAVRALQAALEDTEVEGVSTAALSGRPV